MVGAPIHHTDAPIHLRPTAELAERVLLPGDPGRALALAQTLLEQPRMFNHTRGLWGYTGSARADGAPLTIQATGMGGPSAAIVIEELIALGARRLIRVGTCGALIDGPALGELIVARRAIAGDGASRALSNAELLDDDRALGDALQAAAGEHALVGAVASCDLFYDPDPHRAEAWRGAGALAVEMETATLFALAAAAGIAAASLLAISDLLAGERQRIDDEALVAAGERLGECAVRALNYHANPVED